MNTPIKNPRRLPPLINRHVDRSSSAVVTIEELTDKLNECAKKIDDNLGFLNTLEYGLSSVRDSSTLSPNDKHDIMFLLNEIALEKSIGKS
jgi:hypothetical protein